MRESTLKGSVVGRRVLIPLGVEKAKLKLIKELNNLNLLNKVQFTAQQYEQLAVEVVRDCMLSLNATIDQRVDCASKIVEWARGAPKSWIHDGQTMNPGGMGPVGITVSETIDAARVKSDHFAMLDDLVRRKVPFENWPEDIKSLTEAAAFADEDE